MTQSVKKAPPYPKSHLLAASGVAALLSLALLVFPSSEVEAKKTTLNLELESGSDRIIQEKDDLRSPQVTESSGSPFAQVEGQNDNDSAGKDAKEEENNSLKASNDSKPSTPAE